jgi:hypothetical protein
MADDSFADVLAQIMDTPPAERSQRTYALVERDGELIFEEDEFDFWFDQAVAEALGDPPPKRRVIKLSR